MISQETLSDIVKRGQLTYAERRGIVVSDGKGVRTDAEMIVGIFEALRPLGIISDEMILIKYLGWTEEEVRLNRTFLDGKG